MIYKNKKTKQNKSANDLSLWLRFKTFVIVPIYVFTFHAYVLNIHIRKMYMLLYLRAKDDNGLNIVNF